ncbi:hypothetical protein GDO86_004918 [Hymenochirus boettgeri]|uniref:Calcitonin peptide-like domain-containing protein n=1 Tax=Hymenochirus boettgeri TaxID=247094 RepID=A0A8T2J5B8_9PIPI|nr:hypothetical protein GDO86_004918 [Hymenochirus boettgeri]
MPHMRLPAILIVLSVTLSCRDAAPLDRLQSDDVSGQISPSGGWVALLTKHLLFTPVNDIAQMRNTRQSSHHLEKRKCNTATCVTQRLADFLVRSNNNVGPIYAPTNVGSYTYGKRDINKSGHRC